MPQDVAKLLFDVNEKRRLLSHFKKNAPPPSQWSRALDQLHVFDSDDFRSAFDSVLAEDALLAIKACLLVRATELERVPIQEE